MAVDGGNWTCDCCGDGGYIDIVGGSGASAGIGEDAKANNLSKKGE